MSQLTYHRSCLVTPVYIGQCIMATGVVRTLDPLIGSPACYHRTNQSCKYFKRVEPKYLCTWLLKQWRHHVLSWEWRTQLRWICDVIRHNFKWNVCDVMKRKDLKNFFMLRRWIHLQKLRCRFTFLSENSISTRSRSREVFGQNVT